MRKLSSYSLATHVELVKSGDDFFEKANQIIRNSKHKIHLQTYIFSDDSTGMETINLLADAVKRGVKVYLLVDAFGSHELESETVQIIINSGINFRTYSPLFSGIHIRFGRRLHHKILIGDDKEALIGGINFDNNYHLKGNDSPWLDYAVKVTGDICLEISAMCERLWSGKGYFRRRKKTNLHKVSQAKHHPVYVKLQQNDWLYGKKGISRSLNNSIRHAEKNVTIMASYFLPGLKMRRSLRNASKRNVKVKIILPGVSDVKLVKYAMLYWYAWMLRNNIELYEWNKTILHAKLMAVDNNWASIGSYNINHLSHFSSIETNLEVMDESFCHKVKHELEGVMSHCKLITTSDNNRRMNVYGKFLCWSSFQLVRFLFSLQFAILSKE
jgi:cardiolipin synthase A/B